MTSVSVPPPLLTPRTDTVASGAAACFWPPPPQAAARRATPTRASAATMATVFPMAFLLLCPSSPYSLGFRRMIPFAQAGAAIVVRLRPVTGLLGSARVGQEQAETDARAGLPR